MRPRTVAYFEWIFLGMLAVGVLNSWLVWDETTRLASTAFILTVQVLTFGLLLALVLLISRRRSRVALWVLTGFWVIGLPIVIKQALDGHLLANGWVTGLETIVQLIAIAMLWTPSARAWLKREPAQA